MDLFLEKNCRTKSHKYYKSRILRLDALGIVCFNVNFSLKHYYMDDTIISHLLASQMFSKDFSSSISFSTFFGFLKRFFVETCVSSFEVLRELSHLFCLICCIETSGDAICS